MKNPAQKLLIKLARELYQTESAAVSHARREAARNADSPPATAMLDVANHADRVLKTLPELFEGRGVGSMSFLGTVGTVVLSTIRRLGVDYVMGQERSYRMTLLGMRHGIDLVYELEQLAMEMKDEQLTEWCRVWLERRVPLVTSVERQLQWFVTHPEKAIQGA